MTVQLKTKIKAMSLTVMAILYVFAGLNHFRNPRFYLAIMPPFIPAHALMVQLSGIAEIFLGLALFVKPVRWLAAWGVIALLIAIFPANIYMWYADISPGGSHVSQAVELIRLPLQGVLIYWAYLYTKRPAAVSGEIE